MKMERDKNLLAGRTSSIDPPPPMAHARGTDEQTTAPEFDFLRLAGTLRRRRKLIVVIAAVGAITAGAIGLLVAPKYTATAHIVVEPQRRADTATPMDQAIIQSAVDAHVTMLASRDHLQRVLDSLSDISQSNAAEDSKPSAKDTTGSPNDHLPPPAAINGADEAAAPTNAHTALSFQELVRRLKIWIGALAAKRELDELERGLKVMQERTSRVVSVRYTAKTPGRAAAVANRVVQLYVSGLAEQHRMQVKQELAALDERAAQLKGELEKVTDTLLSAQAPAVSSAGEAQQQDTRLRALEREAASSGQAYAGVLEREKEIRAQQDVIVPEVRIVSLAAPPERPSSVNPILFTLPALIALLIGASLLAVILERLDRGLRSERDVTKALGLPCIGLVPQLPPSYTDRPCDYLQKEPFTPYADAIRSAVGALHLALPNRRPTTILISSSVPGEGKTTLAVSLGVCAARLGRRTLLIDFDSRHPSVMRRLRGGSERFVANLEDRPLEQNIEHLADLDLDYLPLSLGTADPLASFMSTQTRHFLSQLGRSYDCVFIDSPPLLGIAETRLLAALVDSVIFVIKWGSTRREVVQNAGNMLRDALERSGSHSVRASALVTQVDLKKHADYHYGDVGEAYAKYAEYYFESARTLETIKDGSQVGNDERVEASAGSECAR